MVTGNNSYDPSSFGWTVAKNIVDYTYTGPGSTPLVGNKFLGGVASGTEKLWDSILGELVPTITGGLNSASLFGYENRNIAGKSTKSFHAYGLALDINASSNGRGLPKGRTGKYVLQDNASGIASSHGCQWGGDWSYTDPMHIEIHMSPEQVASFSRDTSTQLPTADATSGSTTTPLGLDPKLLALGAIVVVGGIIVVSQAVNLTPAGLIKKAVS